MTDQPKEDQGRERAARFFKQRDLCLEHARDLIASAERLLTDGVAYPNIAYHLAALALEEVGKAGMLAARGAVRDGLHGGWMEKRLSDHVWKMMWAVWSPRLSGKIDPKDFVDAREFAENIHARRIAGLYADYSEDSVSSPPRDAVPPAHVAPLLRLAKTSLEMEAAKVPSPANEGREDLDWFLATVNDEIGQKRLFSQSFVKKHEELGADTRQWVRWARDEFQMIADEEKALLQRELARQPGAPGKGKPRWLIKVRVETPSHSFRQKTLNFWNDRIDMVKLRAGGSKDKELLIEVTVGDHVKLDQLFDFGLSLSKMIIAMLNIGTAGFFWYELTGQAETYYESIKDLDSPNMTVAIGRVDGLPREWMYTGPNGQKRNRVALEDAHLNVAIMAMSSFGFMPSDEAEPIFGQYLQGLSLLAKSDVHFTVAVQARDSFMTALRRALVKFGDMQKETDELLPVLHRVMEPIIPSEEHRTQIYQTLKAPGNSLGDALNAKRWADLYLALVARRLFPDFARRAREQLRPAKQDETPAGKTDEGLPG